MKFASVHLFADTGFSERGVRVPSPNSEIPISTAIWTAFDVRPARADVLSRMDLPIDFLYIQSATYLRAEMQSVDGTDFTFYGWIDSIEPKTDSADTPVTTVRWHVDLWRTWIERARLGRGTVTRRKPTGVYPMQSFKPMFMTPHQIMNYEPRDNLWWCVISYVRETDAQRTTSSVYICFPFYAGSSGGSVGFTFLPAQGAPVLTSPGFKDILQGTVDEKLGLTPSRIVGAWITPVAPVSYTKGGPTSSYEIGFSASYDYLTKGEYGAIYLKGSDIENPRQEIINNSGVSEDVARPWNFHLVVQEGTFKSVPYSDETSTFHVINCHGEIVSTLPAKMGFPEMQIRNVIATDGCYLAIRFVNEFEYTFDRPNLSAAIGCEVRVPLPVVPITENSWSEYAFTGARQYEIDARNAEQDIAHTKGLTNIVEGGISGAFAGGVAGSAPGAIAGGIIGAVGSLVSNEVNYATDKAWNDTLVGLDDTYQARQSENLLITASSFDWFAYGFNVFGIVELTPDGYTAGRLKKSFELDGVTVSEPLEQVSLPSSGPFQVRDLEVLGPVPNEARAFIKARLESGVYIVR